MTVDRPAVTVSPLVDSIVRDINVLIMWGPAGEPPRWQQPLILACRRHYRAVFTFGVVLGCYLSVLAVALIRSR